MRTTSDTATQLVQLRESESLRMFDNHNGRIRDVDTHFDNRCRYEDIDVPGSERRHRCFLFLALQSAVQECNALALEGLGQLFESLGGGFQIDFFGLLDDRINDISLMALIQLSADRAVDPFRIAI